MRGLRFTIVLFMAIPFLPAVFANPLHSTSWDPKLQLNYVGGADRKFYFSENTTALTWSEAREFCANNGMNLATITSVAQQNVLKNASDTFKGVFWTGGRDARTHSQFVWDVNNSPLNDTSAGRIRYFDPIRTCLYYAAVDGIHALESYSCTHKHAVLCEIQP